MSKITCVVSPNGVSVTFDGAHIPKREFVMALKTIEKSYRRQVKEYQHERRIVKGAVNGKEQQEDGRVESGERAGKESGNPAAGAEVKRDGGTPGAGKK